MSNEEPQSQSAGIDNVAIIEYRRYTPLSNKTGHTDTESLREEYGYLRAHFRHYQHHYGRYQRHLVRARIGTTYDIYLARVLRFAALAGLIGMILGLGLVLLLDYFTTVTVGMSMGIGVILLSTVVVGGLVGGGLLLRPWYIARQRNNAIDVVLPHVVVFMHAASQIDPNPVTLIRDVAAYKSIYGELAHEFDTIRKDVDVLNDDLLLAIENAQSHIPSAELREFFDDFSSLLESGGSVQDFLAYEVKQQLAKTEEELEELLRTLTTLAPMFVIFVSVGPVVLLVTLLVLSMVGAEVMALLFILTYLGLPLIILTSIVAIDVLASRTRFDLDERLEPMSQESEQIWPSSPEPWFESYARRIRYEALINRLKSPLETMRHRPHYSLLVTLPLTILTLAVIVGGGYLSPSWSAFTSTPIPHTTGFVIIPMLIISFPVMVLHELRIRRTNAFERRFPDALYSLASSNERGVPFGESIELIARRFEGPIATEFGKIHRDIKLEDDIVAALTNLANRRRNPRVTLTVAVMREIVRSSENIDMSLRSLASDLETRLTLERERRSEMQTYAVVVSLGVLIYLLIILVLDAYLLPQIPDLGSTPFLNGGEELAISVYQMIFFHSSLILAVGSGLIMGKLTRDSLLSGLKYMNALIVAIVLAFLLVGFY